MKKLHTIIFSFLLAVTATAQNKVNLVIFSEDAEPFYAYVNGVKQNLQAETNVRITDLSPNISLRLVFDNKDLPELKKNMSLEGGFEHTARIKRDRNHQLKLQYFGQVPLDESTAENIPSVEYHTADHEAEGEAGSVYDKRDQTSTSTTVTTRTTYESSDAAPVNITMPGVNITMNNTVPQTNEQTTTSSTVTRTGNSKVRASDNRSTSHRSPGTVSRTERCRTAMSSASFSKMKETVEAKPFSDTKMSTAKVAAKNACLSVNQIKEIVKLFSMDEDRLEYAKYAYDYCVDKGNYYQVSEVFSFSSTTDEFNKFLEK